MAKTQITLAVIGEKIDNFVEQNREDHLEINNHLKKLNGQAAKNTEWRNLTKGGLKVIVWITGISGLGTGLFFIIKNLGGI